VHAVHSVNACANMYVHCTLYMYKQNKGGILGGNLDRSLKSFPPCYSHTPLVLHTFCFLDLRFLQATAGKGGGGGFWVNKYSTWITEE
jgi:hypothetical protein